METEPDLPLSCKYLTEEKTLKFEAMNRPLPALVGQLLRKSLTFIPDLKNKPGAF